MAPTSIDGNEITGATIDGQDVSEITVDGQTVFTAIPDSENLRIHCDCTVSDSITTSGSDVTELADLSGYGSDFTNGSGSGEPSLVSNGINDNPVVYFDDSNNDYLSVTLSSNIHHPITIYAVMQAQSLRGNTNQIFMTNNATNSRVIEYRGNTNGAYSTNYGGNFATGGNWDTNPVIFTSIADGSNSEVRANGTTKGTGNVGSNSLGSINLGAGNSYPGNDMDTYLGELRIYENNHSLKTVNEVETQLSEKWGISI